MVTAWAENTRPASVLVPSRLTDPRDSIYKGKKEKCWKNPLW
jgi:hypothetical protein